MIRVQMLTKFISIGGYSPEVSDFGTFIKGAVAHGDNFF